MENAAKALLMAATVLVSLMVLSIAVYLTINFGEISAQIHDRQKMDQINQFNIKFLVYDQRKDLTIHDVITIAKLARESNLKLDLTEPTGGNMYVRVAFKGDARFENTTQDKNQIIRNDIERIPVVPSTDIEGKLPQYTATVKVNLNTQMVNLITITETPL